MVIIMQSSSKSGRDFERVVMRDVNGTLVYNSGAGDFDKGDIRTPNFLIDCKYTDKMSYTIKLDDLLALEAYARGLDRSPALVIGFGKRKYALVDLEYLNSLEEHLKNVSGT